MKSQAAEYYGIIPPLVTPFMADEEFDEAAFRKEVSHMLDAGVHGISGGGSTGEGAMLRLHEYERLCRAMVEETKGRVPVIGGVLRDSTRDAIEYGLVARRAGVNALMITPIHYFVPTDDGMYEYYARIAKEVGLPIIIYNVVPRAVVTPSLMKRLVEIKELVGIKQSGGDMHGLADMVRAVGEEVAVLTAIDDLLLSSFVIGCHGAIAAILAILPEMSVRLYTAATKGELEEARRLHQRILPVVRETVTVAENFPAPVKKAIRLLGRPGGLARSPLRPVSAAHCERIRGALKQAGAL